MNCYFNWRPSTICSKILSNPCNLVARTSPVKICRQIGWNRLGLQNTTTAGRWVGAEGGREDKEFAIDTSIRTFTFEGWFSSPLPFKQDGRLKEFYPASVFEACIRLSARQEITKRMQHVVLVLVLSAHKFMVMLPSEIQALHCVNKIMDFIIWLT